MDAGSSVERGVDGGGLSPTGCDDGVVGGRSVWPFCCILASRAFMASSAILRAADARGFARSSRWGMGEGGPLGVFAEGSVSRVLCAVLGDAAGRGAIVGGAFFTPLPLPLIWESLMDVWRGGDGEGGVVSSVSLDVAAVTAVLLLLVRAELPTLVARSRVGGRVGRLGRSNVGWRRLWYDSTES